MINPKMMQIAGITSPSSTIMEARDGIPRKTYYYEVYYAPRENVSVGPTLYGGTIRAKSPEIAADILVTYFEKIEHLHTYEGIAIWPGDDASGKPLYQHGKIDGHR